MDAPSMFLGRFSGRALGAALVAAFLGTGTVAASVALTRLSTDPYTNTSSQHATQVEPDTFAFGSTIVSAFQTGRFNDGGSSNIGWATTNDNAQTWRRGFLPGSTVYASPKGAYNRISDPVVAYDARHATWLIASLGIVFPSSLDPTGLGAAILVSRSLDDGRTWGEPVTASAAQGSADYDKEWLACDNRATSPWYGRCYAAWSDIGNSNHALMSTSSDGGRTWSRAHTNLAPVIDVQPVVLANGTALVVTLNSARTKLQAFRSSDGGASWGSVQTITALSWHRPAGGLRSSHAHSVETDGAGRIYVAWADCRFRTNCSANDLVWTASLDGATWTTVKRVPIDTTTSGIDHFLPGIGVDPTTTGASARIGLAYYYYPVAACTSSTCRLDVGFISSANGGTSWSAARPLAGPMVLSWLPSTTLGRMVGDYISTSIDANHRAWPVFAVASAPPSSGVYNEAMYTVTGGEALVGGTVTP